MKITKIVLWLSVLILISGCKSTFQSNWRNFNAYYNTFYNAEKSFEAGLQKNLQQSREYNPLQPIRIHPKPINAGAQDFEKAIQKSADILRKHEESKWVDDALFLIGKSYYYREEYFSADQKFRELFITTDEPEMEQKSIIWQGRVLLDLELYSEGVAFLSDQLINYEKEWEDKHIAEVQSLLAQHHVKLQNWEQAAEELYAALPELSKKEYKERGYFLLGQIYEELENYEAAYQAYESVLDHYSEYRVQYLAQRKRAEVARILERDDLAFEIFNSMLKDDKNIEYRSELDFELARTEHERENFGEAERLYNRVLHNPRSQAPAEIEARTYNGLAEIYRFGYNNLTKAAAYYDSAAQMNVSPDRLPVDFNAGLYAESFGEYARITSEIALQDSLLWLGSLSGAELDSVVNEIRQKRIEELEELEEERRRQQDQLVTLNQDNNNQQTTNTSNGFLNENNRALQQSVRQQFYAVWGNRPLADYWRVSSMIRTSAGNEEITEEELPEEDSQIMNIQIDLSGIPFTEAEKDSVQKSISALNYELGNLFFLSLNMPDSAVTYFERAIQNPSTDNVNMVSLYSLSELYSSEGNEAKAREYANQLIEDYPESVYSERLAQQFQIPINRSDTSDANNPIQIYQQIQQQDTVSTFEKAEQLEKFSYNHKDSRVASQALFNAFEGYMEEAKTDSLYENKINEWININEAWNRQVREFEALQDSAQNMMQDTTITEEQQTKYQVLIDSTLQEPDFYEAFPYKGENWDRARAVADSFLVLFPESPLHSRVSILKEELQLPQTEPEVREEETEQEIPGEETVNEQEAEQSEGQYVWCQEIDVSLSVREGVEDFLQRFEPPGDTVNVSELTYSFKVNTRGVVDEFNPVTEDVSEEFLTAFSQYIQEELSFEPVLYEGQAVSLSCDYTFNFSE
ncbi:tetratricopeptide repeat protein [Gracilimonas sp.]|uniref:type IX secretion system periplasmic lipoprotein PorW/SprE n=1 Tax=Gracilimonas sp. TaxID=1974203 RepID=UPI0028726FC1|nr:tetratricopeptide repeat protein [Gracilimonas sp.]